MHKAVGSLAKTASFRVARARAEAEAPLSTRDAFIQAAVAGNPAAALWEATFVFQVQAQNFTLCSFT